MKKSIAGIAVVLALSCSQLQAETEISGFASVVGGKVLSGTGVEEFGLEPTFLANYPTVGFYNEEWTFNPDSKYGLQISSELTEGLTATAQMVGRGADDYTAKFEWASLSYQVNAHRTIQAGKQRLPLYY